MGHGAQPSYTMGIGSFPEVKRPGRDARLDGWSPTPLSSSEVKGSAKLYLYSHYGPTIYVLGWPLSLRSTVCSLQQSSGALLRQTTYKPLQNLRFCFWKFCIWLPIGSLSDLTCLLSTVCSRYYFLQLRHAICNGRKETTETVRNLKQYTEIKIGTLTDEELRGRFRKLREEELNL